ncbi:hypothetical protein O3Q51_01455 [Cryomorphaceae bacterium 1068]|nr:hypothetical protein [Cryomorphaceae bacterium 1068]
MKLTKIFTFLFACFTIGTQAQIAEKTEEKAKQKTEQRVDQKIENGIDSGLDAIEGIFSKNKKKKKKEVVEETETEALTETKSSEEVSANASTMAMPGGADVQVQDEYKFDHRFVILMEDYDKKGKLNQSNEMTFLAKEESSLMGIIMNQEGINTEMIYDLASYEIVTLMNTGGQKIGTTMSIDKSQVESMMPKEDSEATDMSEMPTFKKTGNTKTISGYSCDEYVVENLENGDGSSMTYWVTDELEIDWIKSMANMSGVNKQMPDMYAGSGYPEGSVIQMIVTQKNGERMEMTVKKAEVDQNITISTKGYTFMNIGGR